MKQLKIVQEQVDSQNPFFVSNFTESITISPNSRIWLDKISFNVLPTGIDGEIELGPQVIQVAPNVLQSNLSQGYRSCYLEGATYQTISELYAAMQIVMNGSLNSNPSIVWGNKLPDVGLAYMVTPYLATKQTEISFSQAELLPRTDGIPTNIVFDGDYWWNTSGIFPDTWSLYFPTPILAGALQCNSAVFDPADNDVADMFIGLYEQDAAGNYIPAYGFERHEGGGGGTAWRFSNHGVWTFIDDQSAFHSPDDPPTIRMSWFVDANDTVGHLRCGLFDVTDLDAPVQILISPLGTFVGYDVNTNYYFGANGYYVGDDTVNPLKILNPTITYHPNTTLTNGGWVITPPPPIIYKGLTQLTSGAHQPYPEISVIGPRNVRVNFTEGLALMNGLGFTTIVNYMSGLTGAVHGANIYGFNNFFDLALDVFNFSLESYRSTSTADNKGVKGRVATVGYFIPVPIDSTTGQTMYFAENKQLTFIDIKNEEKQVIESLQMRLYNPNNLKEAYRFGNVSFTLFIEGGDTKVDGQLVRF